MAAAACRSRSSCTNQGFSRVANIAGGINAWADEVDNTHPALLIRAHCTTSPLARHTLDTTMHDRLNAPDHRHCLPRVSRSR